MAYLRSQAKKSWVDLASVTEKGRVALMKHLSITRLDLQAAVMSVGLMDQIVKEQVMMIHSCNFWFELTAVLRCIQNSHQWQRIFVAYWVGLLEPTRKWMAWASQTGHCLRRRDLTHLRLYSQAEEKKTINQRKRFSSSRRLINTMAYMQRALSKTKPTTKITGIEEKERAMAAICK